MVTPNSNICLLIDKDSNPYVLPLWFNACYSTCYVVVSHMTEMYLFTSLAKEVMFLVALVCLSVCLSVDNITQKSYERIGVKFYGGVLGSTMTN